MARGALPQLGDRVGRYEIVAEVARGGMAVVYAARLQDVEGFHKLFAVKLLLPHLQDETEMAAMFLDEAKIASSIHHANVVQLTDIGKQDDVPFMVMEYLRGQSLSAASKRAQKVGTPLSIGLILHVLAQTARGLHAAHETKDATGTPLGIVHRDVSPQNVHVGYDGHSKVVDFGIAAARGRNTKTRTGHIKGKLHYLAPEQITDLGEVDRRADVWALAVVAWELLAGEALFRAGDDGKTLWNVLNKSVPELRRKAPEVDRDVSEVVAAALDRDMATRLPSCAELADVLDASVRTLGVAPADVAAEMKRLFMADRVVEDERLAAALREGAPPPLRDNGDGSDSVLSIRELQAKAVESTSRPPSRRPWLPWVVSSLVAVAGIGIGAYLAQSAPAPVPAVADLPATDLGTGLDTDDSPPPNPIELVPDASVEETVATSMSNAPARPRPRMRETPATMRSQASDGIRRDNPYR